MEFNNYIRKPFQVEALEITKDNMVEIAELVGEIRTNKGQAYIALDRRVVPNVNRAFVGWFLTRLGDNYRCYSPKVFNDQFTEYNPVIEFSFSTAEDEDAAETEEAAETEVVLDEVLLESGHIHALTLDLPKGDFQSEELRVDI